MTKKEIPVSIIMITFEIDKIEPALKCIIKQDYSNKEIIIINDNPKLKIPSSILKLIKIHKIKLVNNPKNLGITKSLNKGIKATKTNIILNICGDYLIEDKEFINHTVRKLYSDKKIGVVNCIFIFPIEEWKNYNFLNKLFMFRHLLKPVYESHGSYKKEVFDKLGLFDSKNFTCGGEDGDFCAKMKKAGYKTGYIEDSLVHMHYNKDDSLLKILKKEYVYGKAHGARKRKDGVLLRIGLFDFEIRLLFIIGFIIGLFINPIISLFCFLPFFFAALIQSIKAYPQAKWLPGLILYPFVGIIILLIQTAGAIKEYISVKSDEQNKNI